jgi:glycosyltransferase involved in cell wall biosynthesis
LIEQKGLIYLLQACRRLLDSGLKVRCDIIGGFEAGSINYYIKLKRLHQVLGLENTVHFAGSLPFEEVLAYYQKADVFVLPCVIAQDGSRDIIPNAVLEAMAMQLPVVSTSITGLPEMIDDGRSGFLVPPHDVEALVASINALAQSTTRRSEFGSAARRRVELRFYSDINVAQYQLLFSGPGNPAG